MEEGHDESHRSFNVLSLEKAFVVTCDDIMLPI